MLGRMWCIRNLDQKNGASSTYTQILVVDVTGKFETLLLTDSELEKIRHRVKKNPEDEIYPTWFDRMTSFLGGFFRRL